jgi:hypothetical protein
MRTIGLHIVFKNHDHTSYYLGTVDSLENKEAIVKEHIKRHYQTDVKRCELIPVHPDNLFRVKEYRDVKGLGPASLASLASKETMDAYVVTVLV